MDDMNAFYQQLLNDDASSWQQEQGQLQNQMGAFGREADVMNARMGRSMGGGYASLAGGALGKGMQAYNQASQAHGDRRRQLQLAWLDKQLQEKQRQEERGWQQDDQNKDQEMQLMQMLANMDPGKMSPELLQAFASGDMSAISNAMQSGQVMSSTTNNLDWMHDPYGSGDIVKIMNDPNLSQDEKLRLVAQIKANRQGGNTPGKYHGPQ